MNTRPTLILTLNVNLSYPLKRRTEHFQFNTLHLHSFAFQFSCKLLFATWSNVYCNPNHLACGRDSCAHYTKAVRSPFCHVCRFVCMFNLKTRLRHSFVCIHKVFTQEHWDTLVSPPSLPTAINVSWHGHCGFGND